MKGLLSLAVAAVALVVVAFTAWELRSECGALETKTAELHRQCGERERQWAHAKQQLVRAREQAAKARAVYEVEGKAAPTAAPKSAEVAVTTKPAGKAAAETLTEFVRRSSSDVIRAEVSTRWLLLQREALGPRYASLFRELGLDVRQQETFKDNFMRCEEQNQDLGAAALTQSFSPNDGGIAKLRWAIFAEYEAAQRALLGTAGYAAMVEFDRTSGLHGLVGTLAATAVVEGTALTPGQTRELVRMIAEGSSTYRSGGKAVTTEVDWAQLRARLPTVLSEMQVKIVTSMAPMEGTGGLQHAEWNAALTQATKAEKEKKAGTPPVGGR